MTRTARPAGAVYAVMCGAVCAACGVAADHPVAAPETTTVTITAPTTDAPDPASARAAAIRDWEEVAREHFKTSAAALERVSEASAAEDEAGLRTGCQMLHDANSIGLQSDLPTPDPRLTAELQRMIDDMNVASHACLRFALGRDPGDAANYRRYLDRAVEHLQRAKVILSAAEG